MKSIGKVFVFLLISFIGIINVYALDEWGIEILAGEPESVRVYQGSKDNIYAGDTTGIYSYDADTNTLTLKEGVKYLGVISADENETFKVTSGGKKVYLNMVYGPKVTLENLVSESFSPESTYAWDNVVHGNASTLRIVTHIHVQDLIIKDSNIKLDYNGSAIYDNNVHILKNTTTPTLGNIVIQNSIFETNGSFDIENDDSTSNTNTVTIKDNSTVKSASMRTEKQKGYDKLYVIDSKLEVYHNEIEEFDGQKGSSTIAFTSINIDNSDVLTNSLWFAGDINIINNSNVFYNDSVEKYDLIAVQAQTFIINNSNVDFAGAVLVNTLTMTNSELSCETGPNDKVLESFGYDGSTESALVAQNIELTNSNFKAVSKGDVPALAIVNTVLSNKSNFILYDDNYNVLEYKSVNPNDYGFFNNPNEYTTHCNYTQMSALPSLYTGLLNNKASKTVYTGELTEVTLKVVNGTWEDGTNDDKIVNIVLGYIPDKDFIKTYPSKLNQELKIERTGDNEYSYIYSDVKNPKTGVASVTILLVASIFLIVAYIYYKDEFTLFKRL